MKADRGLDISCFHRQRFISTGIIHSRKGSELLLRTSCRRLSCLWVSLNPLAHRDYDQYWWWRTLDQTDPRFSSCRTQTSLNPLLNVMIVSQVCCCKALLIKKLVVGHLKGRVVSLGYKQRDATEMEGIIERWRLHAEMTLCVRQWL